MEKYFEPHFHEYLDEHSPVTWGGQKYASGPAFKDHAPNDYQANLAVWIQDRKNAARDRVKEMLQENGCLQRFNRLAERQSDNQILPFVGAGMSKPSGFPLWWNFLEKLAKNDDSTLEKVTKAMEQGNFSDAAQFVSDDYGENMLNEQVENYFAIKALNPKGPVCLIPQLFKTGCITTNFDNVLETVYEYYGEQFRQTYSGIGVVEAPRQANNSEHVLFKIHGTATTRLDRVLTTDEYDRAYGKDRTVQGTLNVLVSNRSLLFLGCSLATDRTIEALQAIKTLTGVNSTRHYAFLPDPGRDERTARHSELDRAEIHPIWYPVEDQDSDHDSGLEDLFLALNDGPLQ